mmetsp:Transcript_16513/g.34073  ORF Transcript_16513/g.34073 Transcript_16513/m.34073 type:complete len:148 (-) Transcript_16513:132-575(-)
MMTPLRPTIASTIRTKAKPTTVWSLYEKLNWDSWNPTVTSVSSSAPLRIGSPLTITTTSPSFTGSTTLESCFKDQILTYTLSLNPLCTMTQTYKIETVKGGETEVTHGVRYDGLMKGFYEGSVGEGDLKESVERIIQLAEEIEDKEV